MKKLALALSLLPTIAFAQPAPPAPDIVLLPRAVAETAAQWIAQPNAGNAVQLYAALIACINDNPVGGVVRHIGQDQCPVVTEALAAQDKLKAADKPTPAPATKKP